MDVHVPFTSNFIFRHNKGQKRKSCRPFVLYSPNSPIGTCPPSETVMPVKVKLFSLQVQVEGHSIVWGHYFSNQTL